ncbi:MAG TPA: argininosuccinate lyase, partial [Syntrophales bacterium]|nr:argininosuccinate lyase [Syntrophales bacterium]
ASCGFLTATDVAEYLVMKGVPFRAAHEIVGRLVAYCIGENKEMHILSLKELRQFHKSFGEDVYSYLKVENAVKSKKSTGGTSPKAVLIRVKEIKGRKK